MRCLRSDRRILQEVPWHATLPNSGGPCRRPGHHEARDPVASTRDRIQPVRRAGGAYELFWAPDDPHNDSTIGCRISALDPGRLLAFQWRSPRQFKSFANAADPLTHVFVVFHGHERDTVITLLHSGWRSTPEWVQAAQWQSAAWDYAFKALNGHAAGMIRSLV